MLTRPRLSLRASVLAITVALSPGEHPAFGDEPTVRAVKQKRHHCGVACAETILRAYRNRRPWTKQEQLAAALCARLPEFKDRRPAAADAVEAYYPEFKETYQPELAELLIDHGYCVVSTRASVDKEAGNVRPDVWELLRKHLAEGHLAIIHVPGHYLAATGIDMERRILYFVDPWRTEKVFHVSFDVFAGGKSFHTTRGGEPRPGWDGRTLIFWKGEAVNQQDRCPVCGGLSAGKTYAYCRKCRCWIDRREHGRVQRALDEFVAGRRDEHITNLSKPWLRVKVRELLQGEFTAADLRAALRHYPLVNDDPQRFATLQRHAAARKLDLAQLSLDDLVEIVSSGDRWRNVLEQRRGAAHTRP
jgi:hypothetical protein